MPSRMAPPGRHPESHPAQVVVKGVQVDVELVGLDIVVPAGERGLHPVRLPVVEPGTDVERVVADEHPYFGGLGGGLALGRVGLGEPGGRLGIGPRGFVKAPINGDRSHKPGGSDLRCGAVPGCGACPRGGVVGC